jgi:hypothetical protein
VACVRWHTSIAVLSAGWALAGCGGGDGSDNGYSKAAETNFLKACTAQAGASQDKCQCALDKIEEKVPFDEFKKADEALREGKQAPAATEKKLQDAVKECA